MEGSFSNQDKMQSPYELSFSNSQSYPINLETNESMASLSSVNTALFPVMDTENSIVSSIQCIETGQSEEEDSDENKISRSKIRHISNLEDPYIDGEVEIDIIEEKLSRESEDRASPSQLEEIEREAEELQSFDGNKAKVENLERVLKQKNNISKHVVIIKEKLRSKEQLLLNANSPIKDLEVLKQTQKEKILYIDSMIKSMKIHLEQHLASRDKNINNLNDYLSVIKNKAHEIDAKIDLTKEKIQIYRRINSKNINQSSPQSRKLSEEFHNPSHSKRVSFHMEETNDADFSIENSTEIQAENSNYDASSKMEEISISKYSIATPPRSIMKTPQKTPMDSLSHSEVNSQYGMEADSDKNSNRSRSNSAKSWNSEGKKYRKYDQNGRNLSERGIRSVMSRNYTPRNISQSSFYDIYDDWNSEGYTRHPRSENMSINGSERSPSPHDRQSTIYRRKPSYLNGRNEIKPKIKLNQQSFEESSWNTTQLLLCAFIFILGTLVYLNFQRTSILI
ncbi:unnamed protein product [Blepharisma stoltei]|uniref:Uncharacterized protein n=1 Tax=Blepharisma stoltei TaxID=1481888 RepID=A0AAU9J8G4_9CILI|nr:unnamed protein product [Blepharisma stoltei]